MKFKNISKSEFFWLILSVVTMGFCLSFLDRTALGTDPCTMFNLGMARLLGLSLGNWQALFNCILFIFVFLSAKEQIGWGTLANMFLVGYSFDLFSWMNKLFLPDFLFQNLAARLMITFPMLALFILAAAIYIAIQQGTAPYDAMPFIIQKKLKKFSFKIVRMGWDISVFIIGFLLGSKAGIVTIIMAFAFGPAIAYTQQNIVSKLIPKKTAA